MTPRRFALRPAGDAPRVGSGNRRVLAAITVAALSLTALIVATRDVQGAGAAPSYSPYGRVEKFVQGAGGMYTRGWAIDPSAPKRSLTVYTTVDGRRAVSTLADRTRTDVAASHAGAGAAHGFLFTTRVREGRHTVCLWAKNLFHGADARLACRTRTLHYGPKGRVEYVRAAHGGLAIKGWAADGDSRTTALSVRVTVGKTTTTLRAHKTDQAIAAAWPRIGTAHGFSAFLPTNQGAQRVCVVAKNIGYGSDAGLGCRTVTLDERPTGALDTVGQRSGALRVRGWTYDVDSPTTPLAVTVTIDGNASDVVANLKRTDVAATHKSAGANHGFDLSRTVSEGSHRVRVIAHNLDLGSDRLLADRTVTLNFTPSVSLVSLTVSSNTVRTQGWAIDPDTSSPIRVRLTANGVTRSTVTANHAGPNHAKYAGRNFAQILTMRSGTYSVCARALNVLYGTSDSRASCRKVTLALSPQGKFETANRDATTKGIKVTGWALDPDTISPLAIAVSVDGKAVSDLHAAAARSDVARTHPGLGTAHGISSVLAVNEGEHRVCLTARNVSGGKNLSLGCKIVIAVHPLVPSAPRSVQARGGYQAASVTWTRPASDGGAPAARYTVVATPGGRSATVSGTTTKATITGLKQKARYWFTVRAVNVAGTSRAATSATVTTLAGPGPQRSPAPVATSRYIRNIRGSSAAELRRMRAEGAADARHNPAGHRYLMLLDIGGQDQYDGGVVLSASTRFVSYRDLVRDVNAYVDGYHSAQHGTAPATIAMGTNNDMDVSRSSGAGWATRVVNPVASHARNYGGLSIAGANDVEPGFRGSYGAVRNWLSGYLASTSRPFVFNGSADGCGWGSTNRRCNNGWSMSQLYALATGMAPTRTVNLPQIYNKYMAAQWKYISLTGVVNGHRRVNFGGPLTQYTACRQSRSCGSFSGRTAWLTLWHDLQADRRLRVSSLPYATDLRIDH